MCKVTSVQNWQCELCCLLCQYFAEVFISWYFQKEINVYLEWKFWDGETFIEQIIEYQMLLPPLFHPILETCPKRVLYFVQFVSGGKVVKVDCNLRLLLLLLIVWNCAGKNSFLEFLLYYSITFIIVWAPVLVLPSLTAFIASWIHHHPEWLPPFKHFWKC